MLLIQNITTDARQTRKLVLEDGTQVSMEMYFVPIQFGWFITSLIYQDFTVNGLRIVNSPNMLHQFKNQIPFGLACFTSGNREPTQQQDFSSGASQLYILTQDEVEEFAEYLGGS